ncbi:hypothetical protein PTW32_11025 [Dechloromonas agitata]|uniref:hypothetical protein n=1 Tax=Dechloromonas agitata TaxID=73030 RepID=UPI00237D90B4|nr:hypothetical protein [Dechloromonas agitata]MDE1545952.1 hypothetical protein [Dechloromonas agitata]
MTTRETELLAVNAALEAEVTRLRNALETFVSEHEECEDSDGWMAQMCSMEALHAADEAMSTPFTPTALEAMIAKVSKVMRERCRVELKRLDYWYSADAIRAIPNVTLEDLK